MNSLPLWKRCRILANGLRLEMLAFLGGSSPQCVKAVAKELKISESVASRHLQLLHTAGFVQHEHRGKYLFYLLEKENALLLAALEQVGAGKNDHVLFMATALTHERRVAIVKALKAKPLEFERLCHTTRISREAMKRHVKKLERREFMRLEDGRYVLIIPKDSLGEMLVGLALKEPTPSKV